MTTAGHRYRSEYARRFFNQGQARALLAVLDARGVQIPEDIRADIATSTDLDKLERWIRRAATRDDRRSQRSQRRPPT